MSALSRRVGRFPARLLRLGSDDEARACCEDFARFASTGRWESLDGAIDYRASLVRVRIPVLQIVSDGDRFECVPTCGERFIACCGGPREVFRVKESDGGGKPPTHMALVTGGRVRAVWARVDRFLRDPRITGTAGRQFFPGSTLN
jgi:hypothetical protein